LVDSGAQRSRSSGAPILFASKYSGEQTGPIHSSTISLMMTSLGGSIMLLRMATLISSRTKSMRS